MTSMPRTSEPGHTKAVCWKSYIHPVVIDAYFEGTTVTVQDSSLSCADEITGSKESPASATFAHRVSSECDEVLTGVQTVIRDRG